MDIAVEDKAPARVPFPTVLASIVGLWVCYFVLITLRSLSLELGFESEMIWRRALVCMAGVITMIGFWLILRLFDDKPLWAKIVAALILSLPVSIILAQSNVLIFASVEERAYRAMAEQQGFEVRRDSSGDLLVEVSVPGATDGAGKPKAVTIGRKSADMNVWQSLAEIGFGRYFMLLAWCALYLAFLTGEKARAAERREGEFRRAAKAAELRSLRYQVNPHFLFNTLNSLSALVLTGKTAAAERMIQTMSTFYRRSLAGDPTVDVSLDEEFALQRLYLDIERARFPEASRSQVRPARGARRCPRPRHDSPAAGRKLGQACGRSKPGQGDDHRVRARGVWPAGGDRLGQRWKCRCIPRSAARLRHWLAQCRTAPRRPLRRRGDDRFRPLVGRLCHALAPPAGRCSKGRRMTEQATQPLRALIVDDEPLAIERMQVLCAELDDLAVVGTASDGKSALAPRRNAQAGPADARHDDAGHGWSRRGPLARRR